MQVLELALFDGVSSGVIGPDDIEDAARELAAALRRSGGRLVGGGSIPIQSLGAAVDSASKSD
jgi:hypothetical protein